MKTCFAWTRGGVALAALLTGLVAAQAGSLKIESWRNDDADIWNSKIIPAFNKHYPDIKVEFSPSAPKEYNAALNARLAGGTAGDIIACRPFDASLDLFNKHQLDSVNDLKGMDNFSDVAKSAWTTDDGKTTFCVPMASVIHGFIYNEDAFKKIGATPPKTMAEFHDILDKLKKDGTYTPIDLGTADQWEAATMGFQNIGPNYWKGETGPPGADRRQGEVHRSAIYRGVQGARVLGALHGQRLPGADLSRQPEPVLARQGGDLSGRLVGHLDLPRAGEVPDGRVPAAAAGRRHAMLHLRPHRHRDGRELRLEEQGGREEIPRMDWRRRNSPTLYSNALPGFFSLNKTPVKVNDPLAATMVGWRKDCKSTIRNSYQILSRGTPNLENELWNVSAQVINGTLTPEAAGKQIQDGLDKWYKPGK